jgi:hypothetical protein
MTRRRAWLVVGLVAAAVLSGCAQPGSFSDYMSNRRHDLIDVLHVDAGAVNVGAFVYALPLALGLNYQTGLKSREESSTLQLGLGGPRIQGRRGMATGLIWPRSEWNEDRKLMVGKRPKRQPHILSFGASLGVGAGLGIHGDLFELLDFVTGLICIDIGEDDEFLADDDEDEDGPPPDEK